MAEVTDEQVRKAVEAEAEEDPEFLASLTEGLSSQRDVRERAARRLDVDEALLKPFKKTIKAVMTDLWTAPGVEPEALEKAAPKPKKAEPAAPRGRGGTLPRYPPPPRHRRRQRESGLCFGASATITRLSRAWRGISGTRRRSGAPMGRVRSTEPTRARATRRCTGACWKSREPTIPSC